MVRAGRLQRVRERRDSGLTLLEGPNVLEEAVKAGVAVREVFGLPDDRRAAGLAVAVGGTWVPVTQPVLDKLAATETPRGPIAVVEIPDMPLVSLESVWLDVSDPGNAGTIIRTAAAFGFGVEVAPDAVDPWSPKVLRSAAGGHFHTSVRVGPPPKAQTVATVPAGGVDPVELIDSISPGPVCVLVGNEAHGLDEEMIEAADVRATIPMSGGVESLNAAISAALIMYELRRARPLRNGS